MPRAGTRKVEVLGEPTFLPEEEARIVELLREGDLLDGEIKFRKAKLDKIKAELAAIAKERRGERFTMHLSSPEGPQVTIVWKRKTSVKGDLAEALREELGEDWSAVFATKLVYTLSGGFDAWKQLVSAKAGSIKKKVLDAILVTEQKPTVTFVHADSDDEDEEE